MTTGSKLHNSLRFVILLTIAAIFLVECGNEERKNIPNVSNIKVKVELLRFEQDLFALDTNNLEPGLDALGKKYPAMLSLFAKNLIHDQTNPNETPLQAVNGFLRAQEVRNLNDTVQKVYGDLGWLEQDLTGMFRYYKYYFPKKATPTVVTVISEYSTDAFTAGDSLCGIGLDMFLGEDYRGYNPEFFPAFIRRQFKKEYITVRLAKALAQNAVDKAPPERRLLDLMLYNGKMLYITDCLTPNEPDSLKMGYTAGQMAGCVANEQEVWARLLDQNLLYSADYSKIRKLVEPSPNAPTVFQEAPGEIGNWMGWQIVKAYMKRHPNTSIEELVNFRDAQKFLEAAKYKPKRN
ncbi:MAG: hypothetical protein WCR52_01020 [Bacteroidota bacterium]